MATLKKTMFEEVRFADAKSVLDSRTLGYNQIRLLPKGRNLRPIMNLRRRVMAKRGPKTLGPSINTILKPVHTFLKLEGARNPEKLGSTLFSVNDIYTKLKSFKASLGPNHQPLYFAKVDVHAAFDTIPQDAVVRLMGSVPSQEQYEIAKHAEVTPGERSVAEAARTVTKPLCRWYATALGDGESANFPDRLETNLGTGKKNTVFIGTAARRTYDAANLLGLLAEHVTRNLVKIGKKYYRQKVGIPQGSILSSFLCNYFYADLEVRYLGFLNDGSSDSLLLRLVDDFLLITLDKSKAVRFVETMHRGIPEYGVDVNANKTMVNFDMELRDGPSEDVADTLTVEFGRCPGQNFERKVLNTFKIQSYHMFYDTEHNLTSTVLMTLYGAFCETATKMWAYEPL
ncbi:telomerase reverse transcriptase [Geosmithia morbida]|uniref:Telomerase reverse transcriptase n=1 Tax=Geosmithia morbida TaxID=1094350 RepID=A0A9P4YUP8_9HYPO|nr:telomerase reverse transcriptase [Geosmithia morbida]KAF4122395.1 telomerase reverse transcriptase [Geosmithia morbida]